MAQSKSHVSFAVLIMSIYYAYLASASSGPQNNYPSGSLACKTNEMTRMDCSNRNLREVPLLDQNSTTTLDLSKNNLPNITSASFEKLKVLVLLNLSYNEISQMSSTAFRGLRSLKILDLQTNKLMDLPKDIFANLLDRVYLDMNLNYFTAIPGHALAPLHFLEFLSFVNLGVISEIDFEGFQKLENLDFLILNIGRIETNASNNIFHQFRQLPLTKFAFTSPFDTHSMSRDIFSPRNSITFINTIFESLPVLISLNSPLQFLVLNSGRVTTEVVDNSSLRVLQKWNASLEFLQMSLRTLRRIEGYTFFLDTQSIHFRLVFQSNQLYS